MGSGFRDFVPGEILTADFVDGYLMRQTIMTFASAAARDSALSGVLDEGMYAYLEDNNWLTRYNGSAWEISQGRCGVTLERTANQSATGSATTAISWDTETADIGGFITVTSSTITIPSGAGGLYSCHLKVTGAGGWTDNSAAVLTTGGTTEARCRPPTTGTVASCSFTRHLAAGNTVQGEMFNAGATQNMTAIIYLYLVGP